MRKFCLALLALLSVSAQAEVWQARYGVAETFDFKLFNADGTLDVDEADGGTEVSVSCNEGAETTATNDFVDEGTFYSIALTATEMQCERVAVVVAATTTEVFFIQTSANASAMTPSYEANVGTITDGAIVAADFASGAITATVIAADAITSSEIADGAIDAGALATDTITAAKIAADAIAASEIAADAIGAAEIANAAIDAATFASAAIDATAIATDAIGAAELAADALGASEIAADAIGASELATGAITTAEFAAGAIDAAAIATDAIGAAEVAANAIAAAEVADGAIDEATFATTAGSFDALGIIDQGTAQAATSTTLQLRSAAAFADDEIIGATCVTTGGSAGVGQARTISDYVASTDTATVDTWTTTPTGTITYQCFGTAASTGGGGLDAAGVRAAVGLASANLDTQLTAIDDYVDTEVAAILVDTGTTLDDLVDDLESRLGTPSNLGGGATVAANLSDIEGQTDDIGVAGAGLTATDDAIMTRVGAPVGASISADIAAVESGISWNSTWDAEVQSESADALAAIFLDQLLANTYNPASPPGAVDSLLEDLVESDAGITRFSANAVEQAPTGTGESLAAIADAVWDELLSGHAVSGSTGEALTSAAAGGGLDAAGVRAAIGLATANLDTQLSAIDNFVDTEVADILVDTGTTLQGEVDGIQADTEDLQTQVGVAGAGLTAVDDAVLAAIAALNNLSAAQLRDLVIEDQGSGVSLGCALSVVLAYAAGDLATTGTTPTYEDPSGTETRATGTIASTGNRTMTITCPTY